MTDSTLAVPSSSETSETLAEAYHRDGYIVLRGCFDAETCRALSREAWRLLSLPLVDPDNHRTPFRKGAPLSLGIPERFDPVIDQSEVFRELSQDGKIMGVLGAIFGVDPGSGPSAHVFKDKLIFKAPGVQGYVMHQDASWWQGMGIETDQFLSVSISIDAATPENGCLQVVPGVHDRLVSTPGEIRNLTDEEAASAGWPEPVLVQTEPGDVVIFHGLTPHCSDPNTTPLFRRSFYLTYNHPALGDRRDDFYEKDNALKIGRQRESHPELYFK